MAIARLVFLQKKLTAQSLGARKEIAELLRSGKTDQAITKVRYIVRDDFLVEAMEIVHSFCDDLLKSTNSIANSKTCDEFLLEQAKSVIYAADRVDVVELTNVADLLYDKFGRAILPVGDAGVYPRLVLKLAMTHPARLLCKQYLEAIAASFDISWTASETEDSDSALHSSADVSNAQDDSEPERVEGQDTAAAASSGSRSSPPPSYEEVQPRPQSRSGTTAAAAAAAASKGTPTPRPAPAMNLPPNHRLPMDYSHQQQAATESPRQPTTNNAVPDFDELTRRFEALRSKK